MAAAGHALTIANQPRRAVERVTQEETRVWNDHGNDFNLYVVKLRQIDLDGCPSDFREAFVRYLASLEESKRQSGLSGQEILGVIVGIVGAWTRSKEIGATGLGLALSGGAERKEAERRLREALTEVDIVARRYCVKFRAPVAEDQ